MASCRGGRRKISKTPTLLLGAFFVLRILDARVQHVLNSEPEGLCDDLQFLQGEVTLIQLPFRYPTADDSALLKLGFRSAVPEAFLTNVGDILLPNVHDFPAFAGVLLLLDGSLVEV